MPTPQFSKPWHGVPRDQISWNPTILEDVCIGCGTCTSGCSRLVYRFDFERKKPVVVDPLNCMVGCTTCANTCPAHAITFPRLETVLALEGQPAVRHAIEDDLVARQHVLEALTHIPHPDRIVTLQVKSVDRTNPEVLRVRLEPLVAGECFCEFTPGQYLELWQPGATFLSRAYSIANASDGSEVVELHLRRVEGGRFTTWAFEAMKVGDQLRARGPLGAFTMRSRPETPLLFVAGGTGIAPILSLLNQQAQAFPERDVVLLWGMKAAENFYAFDSLRSLLARARRLRIVLVAEHGAAPADDLRIEWAMGTVVDAIAADDRSMLAERDLYAAGPAPMLRALGQQLDQWDVARERIHMDSFGV